MTPTPTAYDGGTADSAFTGSAQFTMVSRYATYFGVEAEAGTLGKEGSNFAAGYGIAGVEHSDSNGALSFELAGGRRWLRTDLGSSDVRDWVSEGRVRARFEGSAGQSFGAFLTAGVELRLVGEANDYVGKAMSGGRIVVSPFADDAGDPCLVGNTALYGATGGELFCAGSAGERFAVRNSGAVAVVEGVGDHGCEYMTRGTVVVLGPHGRNLGAGMTGGEAFLLDPDERLVNDDLVALVPLERADQDRLAELLERHAHLTGSARAAVLLEDPERAMARFRRLAPRAELVERDAAEEGRLSA